MKRKKFVATKSKVSKLKDSEGKIYNKFTQQELTKLIELSMDEALKDAPPPTTKMYVGLSYLKGVIKDDGPEGLRMLMMSVDLTTTEEGVKFIKETLK